MLPYFYQLFTRRKRVEWRVGGETRMSCVGTTQERVGARPQVPKFLARVHK